MSRIEELEKRLAADPNSRMFVQLAEEYRKAGLLEQAIDVCEKGLKKHPQYPSARVALGRALLEAGSLNRAGEEFEAVLKAVPDNIVANKFLGETYHRLGRLEEALKKYRVAKSLAPEDAEVDGKIQEVELEMSGGAARPATQTATQPQTQTQPPVQTPGPKAPPVPASVPPPPPPPSAAPRPVASIPTESARPVVPPAPSPIAPPGELEFEDETLVDEPPTRVMDLPPIPLVEVDEPMILEGRDYVPPPRAEAPPASTPTPTPTPTPAPTPIPRAPAPSMVPPPAFDEVEPEAVFEADFEMPAVSPGPAPLAPPAPEPAGSPRPGPGPGPGPTAARPVSDIETPTMAEIYATQGHFDQAIAVYRKILERNPDERRYRERIDELQNLAAPSSGGNLAPPAPTGGASEAPDSRERTIQVLEQWLAAIRKSREAR